MKTLLLLLFPIYSFAQVITCGTDEPQIDALQGRDLNDIRPGGLGIHFIKKVFEGFRFDDQKKKGNRLILTKYLHGNQ